MDEVLARRAWGGDCVWRFRVPDLAALRCTIRNAAAPVVVVAASVSAGRARESAACIETVRGAFAFARAARNDSRGVADTIRVCGSHGFSEPFAPCPGTPATLSPPPLRCGSFRSHTLPRHDRP